MKPIYPFDSNGRPLTRAKKPQNMSWDESQKQAIIDSYEYQVHWLQDRVLEGEERENALKKIQSKLVTEIERLKTKLDEYE